MSDLQAGIEAAFGPIYAAEETRRNLSHWLASRSFEERRALAMALVGEAFPIDDDDPVRTADLVHLSDVEPVRVSWLWPGWIAAGRLAVLDGDPGLGKSAVSLDIAARVTQGDRMPDGSVGLSEPAGVVLLAGEDGLSDTVRPRLDAAGADVHRVVALRHVLVRGDEGEPGRRLPVVRDVGSIMEAVSEVDAALLIVDPLVAHLGPGVNSWRDQDVRAALADLSDLAEETGLAVLAIRHLTKGDGRNALYRGGGSIGIIAAARSGLLLAPDPDDATSDRRILASTKCNLARRPQSLALRLDPGHEGVLRVQWEGESPHDAARLLENVDPEERSARDNAVDMLLQELADGPRPVKDLQRVARDVGINFRTVHRAADRLGIVKQKAGYHQGWTWRLPEGGPSVTGVTFSAEADREAAPHVSSAEDDTVGPGGVAFENGEPEADNLLDDSVSFARPTGEEGVSPGPHREDDSRTPSETCNHNSLRRGAT